MKRWLCLLVLVAVGLPLGFGADTERAIYYVQLIRGSHEDQPPQPGSKRIGPKLSAALRPVFQWKSYWEVNRQQVALANGQKSTVRLSPDREVKIDLTDPAKRQVTVYEAGRPVSRAIRPAGEAMTIIGGDRDKSSAWFIVVRRDKPSVQESPSK
ncbi:MAG: hypothetical protein AAB676_00845 [Verrucomicrobiota bacterium]